MRLYFGVCLWFSGLAFGGWLALVDAPPRDSAVALLLLAALSAAVGIAGLALAIRIRGEAP